MRKNADVRSYHVHTDPFVRSVRLALPGHANWLPAELAPVCANFKEPLPTFAIRNNCPLRCPPEMPVSVESPSTFKRMMLASELTTRSFVLPVDGSAGDTIVPSEMPP